MSSDLLLKKQTKTKKKLLNCETSLSWFKLVSSS